MRTTHLLLVVSLPSLVTLAEELELPPRPSDAPGGSDLARQLATLPLAERETALLEEVLRGNIPGFLRRMASIKLTATIDGKTVTATCFVTPDYLAVGHEDDFLRIPLTPRTAQRLADSVDSSLPTSKIVDAIHAQAPVQLEPSPIAPSEQMTTLKVFAEHDATITAQRVRHLRAHPAGVLVAGHKKDVVLSASLRTGRVAIYGWHRSDGRPIQPLYGGHRETWVDYSHGIRLVHNNLRIGDRPHRLEDVIGNVKLAPLLSSEGVVAPARYRVQSDDHQSPSSSTVSVAPNNPDFRYPNDFRPLRQEDTLSFRVESDVKVHINAPPRNSFRREKLVQLILYGLPNGNTIEWTIGRAPAPGIDWHFGIQHIGAQTRFLRARLPDRNVVIAYLEEAGRSWPAWCRRHEDNTLRVAQVVDIIRSCFRDYSTRITWSGHSGGGRLIFSAIDGAEKISASVERISFLDSNYGYSREKGHATKLTAWLKGSDDRYLNVFAYNDAAARLNGKPFVSRSGGTWGRSQAMEQDLAPHFDFRETQREELRILTALDGRIKFLLRENPERKILHTVLVEKNGFIESVLAGTPAAGIGYAYLGPPAYTKWITP